jgi:hypothetical protein
VFLWLNDLKKPVIPGFFGPFRIKKGVCTPDIVKLFFLIRLIRRTDIHQLWLIAVWLNYFIVVKTRRMSRRLYRLGNWILIICFKENDVELKESKGAGGIWVNISM